MNRIRYNQLMYQVTHGSKLTKEEIEEGWHFCPDWDFLLIGPDNIVELECCTCEKFNDDV